MGRRDPAPGQEPGAIQPAGASRKAPQRRVVKAPFSRLATALGPAFALLTAVCIAVFGLGSDAARGAPAAPGQTYYLSSSAGNDSWDGTSPDRPWRSLARASQFRFAPGDRVLFKAGDTFAGQLEIASSGAPGRPLSFSRYGEGPKPLIAGGSADGSGRAAAILIRNQQHIAISDLEVTNTIERAEPGIPRDWSFGILVLNEGAGHLSGYRIERMTIRDVFAERLNHATENAFNKVVVSAIRFVVNEKPAGSVGYFSDIAIIDNQISRSGRFGVQISHPARGDAGTRHPNNGFNRDIVIRGNRFFELGGSAVQLGGARLALIENNDFDRTGSSVVPGRMVGRGSGAWVINSRDIVAQHNRSRSVRGHKDSYGMHVDFGNLNVLYQYNYSEDSEGGFVEILGRNRNIIWRYNISVNDGTRAKDGNTIWLSPWSPGMVLSDDVYIYNNTVFVGSGLFPDIDIRAKRVNIWNNIFYVADHAMIGEKVRIEMGGAAPSLAGNLFFGAFNRPFMARDTRQTTGDPLFVQPGLTNPMGYRLRAGSPALNGGVAVAHPPFPAAGQSVLAGIKARPDRDFFGTPLGRAPGIGAAVTLGD